MENNNAFIENLQKSYKESIKMLDEQVSELIKADANMAAISKFTNHLSDISGIYDTSEVLYSLVYNSKNMLKHFKSSKADIKQIPLISFFKEDTINSSDMDIYKKLLHENYSNFLDEDDNFESDEFDEFLVMNLLDEEGYNKKHWYFKASFINELEFMLDFLLEFVEEDYNPIDEENDENENKDRYISKAIKIAVWRRDLGKCVDCGSKEKLEYDHIIPVAKGGSNTERNIQLLCEKCNRKKSDSIQ